MLPFWQGGYGDGSDGSQWSIMLVQNEFEEENLVQTMNPDDFSSSVTMRLTFVALS